MKANAPPPGRLPCLALCWPWLLVPETCGSIMTRRQLRAHDFAGGAPALIANIVKPNLYQDSVALMQIAAQLKAIDGIAEASLMMGTVPNKEILQEAGLLAEQGEAAGPNDLLIALKGSSEAAISTAEEEADQLLQGKQPTEGGQREAGRPHTIAEGAGVLARANLALISTPRLYAA